MQVGSYREEKRREEKRREEKRREEKRRVLQTGFLGSAGFDIGKQLRVGLKYEHSSAKVGDDYKYAGKKLTLKSTLNYMTFSVGTFF